MSDTFNKRENEKRKEQKKKEKEQRKADRKANAKAGNALEDMIAYVDENGNISSTPPDPTKKKVINENEVVIGSRNIGGAGNQPSRKGVVAFFNTSKNYGFIKDVDTGESIFVHGNALSNPIKDNDVVTFDTESGPKGLQALNVKVVQK